MAYRLTLATALATLVLIVFGGLVTNTGAGLAVPDWPTTFGYNMFLYPWSQMVGGIFYEHSHRLIGSVVGLLTLALSVALWRRGGPFRMLAVAAVAAVCVQGVLGGLRVVLQNTTLAIIHGCVAQAFFGFLAALAVLTSSAAGRPARNVDPTLRRLAIGAAALIYLQIVFGALVTHTRRLDLHVVGAFLVLVLVPMLTARLRRSGDEVAVPVARTLAVLLSLQLLLGVASYLARFTPLVFPGGPMMVLVLPVAHRVTGALVLGAAVILAVRLGTAETHAARGGARLAAVPGVEAPSTR